MLTRSRLPTTVVQSFFFFIPAVSNNLICGESMLAATVNKESFYPACLMSSSFSRLQYHPSKPQHREKRVGGTFAFMDQISLLPLFPPLEWRPLFAVPLPFTFSSLFPGKCIEMRKSESKVTGWEYLTKEKSDASRISNDKRSLYLFSM